SKANFTPALPLVTGGSWKKSPVTTTWPKGTSPNGSGRLRIIEPMRASLSNRSPSTIDTVDRSHQQQYSCEPNEWPVTFVDDENLGT
ncbi:hypothetical protein GY45DRAFT_1249975, partial [Cubamyces sp. BRFM 1775]